MTRGGIHLPDSAKKETRRGTVVSAGPGVRNKAGDALVPMTVKAGDEVLYGRYAGSDIEFEGEKYIIMRESEVLARLTP